MVGFIFSSIPFVMEFVVSQNMHKQTKMHKKQSVDEERSHSIVGDADHAKMEEDMTFDLSQQKSLLKQYLVYFLGHMSLTGDLLGHPSSLSPTTDHKTHLVQ